MKTVRLLMLPVPLLIVLAVLSSGCPGGSTSGDPGLLEAPIPGEAAGSLSGHVIVMNAEQQRLADKSGIEVTIEGFPHKAVTNANGKWSFDHVPEGLHTITWTKHGFGMTRIVGYPFRGGNVHSIKVWIVEQPHFAVAGLQDSVVDGSVLIEGETRGETGRAANAVRFFVGSDPRVSANPEDYRLTTCISFLEGIPSGAGNGQNLSPVSAVSRFSTRLERSLFEAAGFHSGSHVYIVAHADGIPSVSYTDPLTARDVFTTINPEPSPILHVILP